MREILFRGKRCDNGEWVYGDVAHSIRSANGKKPHKSWIVNGYFSNGGWLTPLMRYAVIDETVGQYTGLKDNNGTRIFEGDIIKCGKYLLLVEWEDCTGYHPFNHYGCTADECEVIGNIHDNPELLEGELN